MIGRVEICADAASLAERAAELLIARVANAPAPVRVALSGGSTPRQMLRLLAEPERAARMRWERLAIYWGDERCVPYASQDSNYGEARRLLLDRVPAPLALHPFAMDVAPEEAAARYAADLATLAAPIFNLVFLGLGEDGHTASLLPGEPVLAVRDRLAAVVGHGRPEIRLTLTYPALQSAELVVFLVSGAGKQPILRRLRDNTADVPASRLRPLGETLWLVDRDAMGRD